MAKSIEHNLFPELSPRAELIEKIGLIEKAWLDETPLRFPSELPSLLQGFSFFRLQGGPAVFDEQTGTLQALGFSLNLLAAINNLRFPLFYVIKCQGGRIEVAFGTNAVGQSALFAALEAALGPSLYEPLPPDWRGLDNCRQCVAVTGIPSETEDRKKSGPKSEAGNFGIDGLISGLLTEEWVYIVQAFPVPRPQTGRWLEACAGEIKDIKESFLLRDIQKANRMGVYYVEVLEKTIKRLQLGKQQGMWQTGVYLLAERPETVVRGAALLAAIFAGEKSAPEPLRTHLCTGSTDESPLVNCLHSRELQAFVALPTREYSGFCLQEKRQFDMDFEPGRDIALTIGRIIANRLPTNQFCSVPVADLTKHALVAGVTGSGKTNTIFNLVEDLACNHGVPFLVIEPAKAEYRNLLNRRDSLLIFTLGEERPGVSAPFRLNPFAFPAGVSLQTHLDFLLAVFHASFVMYAPMPYVLHECLVRIYQDKGWDLVTSDNLRGVCAAAFPTLTDLYRKIGPVVDDLGYQDRTTMDIKAALKTRIKSLCLGAKGMMLNTSVAIPFAEIMSRPTVLELKYLGNDEEKAFMMGLILMSLWEYYEALPEQEKAGAGRLKHLTIIEEAHRLLKNVSTEKVSEEQNNVKGMGVETFCHLLAEIRAYGEGILVSEQIPTKLAPDVIKNSNLKIMHRLVAREDRELMGDTMNLDQHQKRQVVSLGVGEAVFFREGLDRPMQVMVPLAGVSGVDTGTGRGTGKAEGNCIANGLVQERMAAGFYARYPALLLKFPGCLDCPHRLQDCVRNKNEVERMSAAPDWEETAIRFFLPYLFEPNRGQAIQHLLTIIPLHDAPVHCPAAHLIHDYVNSRGNFGQWPFEMMGNLIERAQRSIPSGNFAAIVGQKCRENTGRSGYSICSAYCRQPSLLCHEGKVLANDPVLHNKMLDLLRQDEYGPRFFIELAALLGEQLREYLPADQTRFLGDLCLCYLIRKLNEHRFSVSLQHRILAEFVRIAQNFH